MCVWLCLCGSEREKETLKREKGRVRDKKGNKEKERERKRKEREKIKKKKDKKQAEVLVIPLQFICQIQLGSFTKQSRNSRRNLHLDNVLHYDYVPDWYVPKYEQAPVETVLLPAFINY